MEAAAYDSSRAVAAGTGVTDGATHRHWQWRRQRVGLGLTGRLKPARAGSRRRRIIHDAAAANASSVAQTGGGRQ